VNDEVLIALGRLEGKVDAMMTALRVQEQEIRKMDERIRHLEQSKAWLLGAAAVISLIAGFVVKLIPLTGAKP
jgi:hypothetical protein